MGIYLNPGNEGFAESVRSEIYVDKSGLKENISASVVHAASESPWH